MEEKERKKKVLKEQRKRVWEEKKRLREEENKKKAEEKAFKAAEHAKKAAERAPTRKGKRSVPANQISVPSAAKKRKTTTVVDAEIDDSECRACFEMYSNDANGRQWANVFMQTLDA